MSPRQRWQNTKFTQDPRHPLRRLRSHAQPVLESIDLEANLLGALDGERIVRAHHLQKATVARTFAMRRDNAVKGRVDATEPLTAQADWAAHYGVIFVCLRLGGGNRLLYNNGNMKGGRTD